MPPRQETIVPAGRCRVEVVSSLIAATSCRALVGMRALEDLLPDPLVSYRHSRFRLSAGHLPRAWDAACTLWQTARCEDAPRVLRERYRVALLDWLACATAGAAEPAARAARAAGSRPARAGGRRRLRRPRARLRRHLLARPRPRERAGRPGGAAPCGRARAGSRGGVGRLRDRFRGDCRACAREPSGALRARLASDRGMRNSRRSGHGRPGSWSSTKARPSTRVGLSLLRAGGLRAAFGSHGKAIQVGAAAAAGVHAARLAAAGAEAPLEPLARGPAGFEQAFGGSWPGAATRVSPPC